MRPVDLGHVAHLCELSQAHSDRVRAKARARRRRLDQAAHAVALVLLGLAAMLSIMLLSGQVPHV